MGISTLRRYHTAPTPPTAAAEELKPAPRPQVVAKPKVEKEPKAFAKTQLQE